MISALILKNRSYRRFHQNVEIPASLLTEMVNNARLSASGRNLQPLKYILVRTKDMNARMFPLLAWAGYLKDWPGPSEGERPSAYVVQLHDTGIAASFFCDDGIAAQSILLTAVEQGFGGCIIASVKKQELAALLNLPENLKIIQVIALGKPKETVIIEDMKNGRVEYWRDEQQVHHVPKRGLGEVLIGEV
jgi:nitroreductase